MNTSMSTLQISALGFAPCALKRRVRGRVWNSQSLAQTSATKGTRPLLQTRKCGYGFVQNWPAMRSDLLLRFNSVLWKRKLIVRLSSWYTVSHSWRDKGSLVRALTGQWFRSGSKTDLPRWLNKIAALASDCYHDILREIKPKWNKCCHLSFRLAR